MVQQHLLDPSTSTTPSITTTALAVVVLLLVVLVPAPPTKTHIDLRTFFLLSQVNMLNHPSPTLPNR